MSRLAGQILALFVLAPSAVMGQAHNGKLQIEVNKAGDDVYVLLVNHTSESIKITTLFNQNPAFGVLDVYLSEDGKRFLPMFSPNENLPTKASYVALEPYSIYGEVFPVDDLFRIYGVKTECATLTVTYHDLLAEKFGGYSGSVTSKPVHLCSTSRNKHVSLPVRPS